MPLYMDIHRGMQKASREEIERAHISDLEAQGKHNVHYIKYWIDSAQGNIYCLVEGPNKEACVAVHREAHGLIPDSIVDVESELLGIFLGQSDASHLGCAVFSDGALDAAFRTVLFTDIADSTRLTQKLGDTAARALFKVHDDIVRNVLASCHGSEVKHTGDGLMAVFVSASHAIDCATAVQQAIAGHNRQNPERPIGVRIGISAGEPVAEGHDFFGAAVQLARRVCDEAEAGQIFVSNVVRDLCLGKDYRFVDHGRRTLKGFDEPVRVHEVVWSESPAKRA
jgi:class 3 adenylate cyclase